MKKPVLAAGTVCFRRVTRDNQSRIMVLLVHRTRQRDVSFPKGKIDPGESMPEAAARETLEETGLKVALGVNLGLIHYLLPTGNTKTVQYWAAEVTDSAVHASTFKPNGEISALEWVDIAEVSGRLSYEADRELFDVFMRLAERDAIETFAVILLRHAKAEPRSDVQPQARRKQNDSFRCSAPSASSGYSAQTRLVASAPSPRSRSTWARNSACVRGSAKKPGILARPRVSAGSSVASFEKARTLWSARIDRCCPMLRKNSRSQPAACQATTCTKQPHCLPARSQCFISHARTLALAS
jgi:8-oxo-dGTP pyrophosphatase MutT (NUDIX family)